MTAKHTQPWLAATSSSLGGGVAIRGLPLANGEGGAAGEASSRSRALVEQHEPGSGGGSSGGTLAALTAAAAGLVATRRGAPPPAPIPKAWLEVGPAAAAPRCAVLGCTAGTCADVCGLGRMQGSLCF
jgi:hypothetical protein